MKPRHKNPWGDSCSCPWFKPAHQEHVGATKEAAKIDWLRERPDVQKDLAKRLLVHHEFPRYGDIADPLLPWILREYNKGHLTLTDLARERIEMADQAEHAYHKFIQAGFDPQSTTGQELQSRSEALTNSAVEVMQRGNNLRDTSNYTAVSAWAPEAATMLDTEKKRGRGIDVMQHNWYDLIDRLETWLGEEDRRKEEELRKNNGQVVHRWDEGHNAGWSVRRLQNADECSLEGELMGHCVGSYGSAVESGRTNIYSLRDAKNNPHVTMEIEPTGSYHSNPTEHWIPNHVWNELPMKQFQGVPIEDIRDYHDLAQEYGSSSSHRLSDHPAHHIYPEFMQRAVEHGTAAPPVEGNVTQSYGHSDAPPLPEYTDMMDEFLAPHNLQSFKPWWEDWYEMEGPQNFRELVGHNGEEGGEFGLHGYPSEDWYQGEHEIANGEYDQARNDAEEHGLPEPELRITEPDYYHILESLIDPQGEREYNRETGQWEYQPPWRGYNPQAGEYVLQHVQTADEREREHPEWAPYRQGPSLHTENLANALRQHVRSTAPQRFIAPPELQDIVDPYARRQALEEAEKQFYNELGYDEDPYFQMFNHLGPQLIQGYEPYGIYRPAQPHPEQRELWDPESGTPLTGLPLTGDQIMGPEELPNVFTKVASLYQRWVFSPVTGNVELSDNNGDPLDVKYHTDLARELNEPNLVHGYAYRIGNGWRLFDWDNTPVEDPYVIAQVMRRLQRTEQDGGYWDPDYEEDWDRLHLGIPG